jgi:hypothetical protein
MTITATAADNAKGLDYFKENKVSFLFFLIRPWASTISRRIRAFL